VEIEKWDAAARQAWLWVKVPVISAVEDTVLYLYYDNAQPDNSSWVGYTGSSAAQNVWSDQFVMVQHLNVSSRGEAGEFLDSTSRRNDGTGFGFPELRSGKVGDAQFFDGDDDYISVPGQRRSFSEYHLGVTASCVPAPRS
jgi:hypothetical protein